MRAASPGEAGRRERQTDRQTDGRTDRRKKGRKKDTKEGRKKDQDASAVSCVGNSLKDGQTERQKKKRKEGRKAVFLFYVFVLARHPVPPVAASVSPLLLILTGRGPNIVPEKS